MLRIIYLTLVIICTFLLYTGCSKFEPTPSLSNSITPTDNLTLNIYLPGASKLGTNENDVITEIENRLRTDKNLDVTLNFTYSDWDIAEQQIDDGIASGKLDAFTEIWSAAILNRMAQGEVISIDNYLNQNGEHILAQTSASLWDIVKYQGAIMGIPIDRGSNECDALWIRKDLLDQAGLPIPQSIEDVEADLRVFKTMDPSMIPFAQMDFLTLPFIGYQIPVKCTDNNGNLIPYFFWNGYLPIYYSSPEFKDFMTIMQRWVKDGLINFDQLSWSNDQTKEYLREGKIGAVVQPIITDFDQLMLNNSQNSDSYGLSAKDWICVTNMKAPSGQYLTLGSGVGKTPVSFTGITKSCKNPEAVIQVIDWLATDMNNMILAWYGREGIEYNMVGGKIQQIDAENPLYSGILHQLDSSLFSMSIQPLAIQYATDEWMKAFDPSIHWCVPSDAGIPYTYPNSLQQYNACQQVISKYYYDMFYGNITVEDGITQMTNELNASGIDQVLQDMNNQYKTINFPAGHSPR